MRRILFSRRTFFTQSAACACATLVASELSNRIYGQSESSEHPPAEPSVDVPLTGPAVAGLESFDRLLISFVRDQRTPGISLAVGRNGKLLYARACGSADREKKLLVQPESRFRIASVSKPLTAVAVLQLAERGKLDLDAPVLDFFPALGPLVAKEGFDERWRAITVRHCLHHTGGWDREKSYDPVARPEQIAAEVGSKSAAVTPLQIIQSMLGRKLDFDPGQRYAYSNLGYLILGRIIEQANGQPYETYVREHVLAPLGIRQMQLGRALRDNQLPGEVCYYDSQGRTGTCLYPPLEGKPVPLCYGAENFENFEAHGGWIASASDLVRFAAAFADSEHSLLLKPESLQTMWAPPAGPAGHQADGTLKSLYYGCGWNVRPAKSSRYTAWHGGYIAGSEALLVRRWDGLIWAVLFNTAGDLEEGKSLVGRIDPLLHAAAAEVKEWPAG